MCLHLLSAVFRGGCETTGLWAEDSAEDSPAWHKHLRKARSRARKAIQKGRPLTELQQRRLADHHGTPIVDSSPESIVTSMTNKVQKWRCQLCGWFTLARFFYCSHCCASKETATAVVFDKSEELKRKEEELKKQLELLRAQKEKLKEKVSPKMIPAEASPFAQSAAASLRAKEAALKETEKAKQARQELGTYVSMLSAIRGDSSTVAMEHRAQLEQKITDLRQTINLEMDPEDQVSLLSLVVTQQSEKLQRAIQRVEESRIAHEKAAELTINRRKKYQEATESLYAAQIIKGQKDKNKLPVVAECRPVITRAQLMALLADASYLGLEEEMKTQEGLQMMERALATQSGGITPPSTPVRSTGKRTQENLSQFSPARRAAAEAAKKSEEAIIKAQEALVEADQAQMIAKNEEMGNTDEEKEEAEVLALVVDLLSPNASPDLVAQYGLDAVQRSAAGVANRFSRARLMDLRSQRAEDWSRSPVPMSEDSSVREESPDPISPEEFLDIAILGFGAARPASQAV